MYSRLVFISLSNAISYLILH
uniref:Uncharacterized protein n=1 Tax=Arundo donax TaxID=35708 RepID=A0A0A9B1N3_ARUDO